MASQLELFRATVAHEPHDEFLYQLSFTPDLAQRTRKRLGLGDQVDLAAYFGAYQPKEVNLKAPPDLEKPCFARYYAELDIPAGAFINQLGVLETPGSMYHFTSYTSPLRQASSLNEIMDFPYPSVAGFTDQHMKAAVARAHSKQLVTCCSLCHMYEDAWQIRGYEEFLIDMLDNPEICHFILDKIMARNLARALAAARAGVDVLITGDDVASQRDMMFSLPLWRSFIKDRWARVYQAARQIKPDIQIWYHSDGNIAAIIPELIEIGVTILNPVQPECLDPLMVKKLYGQDLVLHGTIGTQTTMPFATAGEIRQLVKARIKTLGSDGALILGPTHVLEPDVPVDNVLALVQACRQEDSY